MAFDQLEGTLTRVIPAIEHTPLDLSARLEASIDFPDEGCHVIDPAETARAIGAIGVSSGARARDSGRAAKLL